MIYKKTISDLEQRIIAITGDDIDHSEKWLNSPSHRKQVAKFLASRQHLLNEMFNPTPDNMSTFQSINERLYTLTQQLFARVKSMEKKLPLVMDAPDFDDDYEIEGTLRFCYNDEDSVLKLEDDAQYGSNFPLMIKLISDLFHGSVTENIEQIGPTSLPLDDGVSWDEYPFRGHKDFNGIIICHAVHQLTDHQLYSIPDLLRLNDFWAEVKMTVQSITTQNGTRFNPKLYLKA